MRDEFVLPPIQLNNTQHKLWWNFSLECELFFRNHRKKPIDQFVWQAADEMCESAESLVKLTLGIWRLVTIGHDRLCNFKRLSVWPYSVHWLRKGKFDIFIFVLFFFFSSFVISGPTITISCENKHFKLNFFRTRAFSKYYIRTASCNSSIVIIIIIKLDGGKREYYKKIIHIHMWWLLSNDRREC